ncbi:hypothetical protein RF11_15986 [Thelohanellus kitauei]|uniref:Uncharacterized protein n=1 Tax=Thelohanellus kitauei TaxID=669202 RepID=A0A0C2MY21_THEKT|nr:hypothetical protein RF11_15986 [Thelohanellus kitauei]
MGRSLHLIKTFCSNPAEYGQKLKKSGRKKKTDNKIKKIVELAKGYTISKSCPNASFLTEIQKNKRLEWAKEMISKIDCDLELFTNEKGWNLDGNYSNLKFWGDKEVKLKNSKQGVAVDQS